MMHDLSRKERRHLANNRETTTDALIPKRCACRKAAKAKQLDQHGKCVACRLVHRVAIPVRKRSISNTNVCPSMPMLAK